MKLEQVSINGLGKPISLSPTLAIQSQGVRDERWLGQIAATSVDVTQYSGVPGVVFKNWIDVHYAVYKGHYTSISIEGHMNSEIVQTSCRWQYHLTLVKHKKLYTSPIYPILYSAHIPHPLLGMPTFLSKVVEPLFFSSAKKHLAILFLLTAYFSFFPLFLCDFSQDSCCTVSPCTTIWMPNTSLPLGLAVWHLLLILSSRPRQCRTGQSMGDLSLSTHCFPCTDYFWVAGPRAFFPSEKRCRRTLPVQEHAA